MDDRFRKVEDEYFRLKGQLQAGRITREQFESTLRGMMPQDAQGRYWMLGVDDAKWYVNDGGAWVQSQPPQASTTGASSTATSTSTQPESRKTNKLGILGIVLFGIGLCSCLACAGFSFVGLDSPRSGGIYYLIALVPLIVSVTAFVFSGVAYRRGR